MQFSPNPIDLFAASQKKNQHIFFDSSKGQYFLDQKGAHSTNQKIKELNLHDIAILAMKCDPKKMSNSVITEVVSSLEEMADKTEKKHFSGIFGRINALFDAIYNKIVGRGFQTTASAVKQVALQLKQNLSPAAAAAPAQLPGLKIKELHEFLPPNRLLQQKKMEQMLQALAEFKLDKDLIELLNPKLGHIDPNKLQKPIQNIFKAGNMGVITPESINSFQIRTLAMKKHLKKLPEYDDVNGTLKISGKDYRVVTSDIHQFNESPLVSCGSSSSREMILFDPANSPLLQNEYASFDKFLSTLLKLKGKEGKLSPDDLIQAVDAKLQGIFTEKNLLEEKIEAFVEEKLIDGTCLKVNDQPCIPIDEFIKKKTGVCRHHSLIAAYFMDRYIREHPERCAFDGKIQIMRDNVTGGAHAWVTLVCGDGRIFTVDTLNKIKGELTDEVFKKNLALIFGKKAVEHQLIKAKKLQEAA